MKTTIYYYSATGNSLSLARILVRKLGDSETELVSMARYRKDKVHAISERVGFVYPVHAWGSPGTVEEFFSHFSIKKGVYTFAIVTCAGLAAGTLLQLQKKLLLAGADLDAGFIVKQKPYSPLPKNIFDKIMIRIKGRKEYKNYSERLEEILDTVINKKKHKPETNSRIATILGNKIHEIALPGFKKRDQEFWTDNNCNMCNLCKKVCPRQNISIENNSIKWNEDCDSCFSCYSWCPKSAIQFKDITTEIPRNHHEEVFREDMLLW